MKSKFYKLYKIVDRILLIFGLFIITILVLFYFRPWVDAISQTGDIRTVQDFHQYNKAYQKELAQVEQLLPVQKSELNVPSLSVAIGYKG